MKQNTKALFTACLALILVVIVVFFQLRARPKEQIQLPSGATPTPSASPSATPTPRPLTFAEMNARFGPCTVAPTLMYHHIEDLKLAKDEGHQWLAVSPENLRAQFTYLSSKGYTVLSLSNLINFFDAGTPLPKKAVFLTFDDGYLDFYQNAYPLLREFNFPATVFVPTGLLNNAGYLNWQQISEMKGSGLVYFANHTWSHHNVQASNAVITKEVTTAATQLSDHDLDGLKIFAYPYGLVGSTAPTILTQQGFKLAFTTQPGRTLCAKQRLILPRIRIGNGSLSAYSL